MNKRLTYLEGLRVIPFGMYMLSIACWRLWLHSIFNEQELSALLITFIVLGGLALLIERYYQHALGSSKEASEQDSRQQRGTLLLLFFLYIFSTGIDSSGHFPVSMLGLTTAIVMAIFWWEIIRTHYYYMLLPIFIALLSLSPLLHILGIKQGFFATPQYINLIQLFIALSLIIEGLSYHFLFLQMLRKRLDA